MKFYLLGVFVAVLISLVKLTIMVCALSSIKNKNLKKIGLHYSPWAGNYTKNKISWKGMGSLVAVILLIEPLLSWINVCYATFQYIKKIVNKVPVPEKVKEINFKLSSVTLPKDKVEEYVNESAQFFGLKDADLRTLDHDCPYLFILESAEHENDWYRELTLDRTTTHYTIYDRSPDIFDTYTDIYEYRFKDNSLWIKAIESKSEYMRDIDYNIRNNVVLEDNVRVRLSQSLTNSQEYIEDKIQGFRRDIEWHECNVNRSKYFIMFRHSDLFPSSELKTYFHSELERINYGYKALVNKVNAIGGYIGHVDVGSLEFFYGWGKLRFNKELPNESIAKLRELIEGDSMTATFGISYYEFDQIGNVRQDLEKYLAKV